MAYLLAACRQRPRVVLKGRKHGSPRQVRNHLGKVAGNQPFASREGDAGERNVRRCN
jgi:hypothetical protein